MFCKYSSVYCTACYQLCASCAFFLPSLHFFIFSCLSLFLTCFFPFVQSVFSCDHHFGVVTVSTLECCWLCQLLCITLPLSLELSQGSTWCGICSVDSCIKEIWIILENSCKALIQQREFPWRCKGFILFNQGFISYSEFFCRLYWLLCFNCKLNISVGSEWWRCVPCT